MEYFIALKQVLKPAHYVHQARKHTDLSKCNLCGFIVCVCVCVYIYIYIYKTKPGRAGDANLKMIIRCLSNKMLLEL